jgi:hypothetical protein
VPGSPAYGKRTCDAVPDEVEIIPEGSNSRRQSTSENIDRPLSPSGGTTPRTVVEKVDPESPSYGDVPGTPAYDLRKADTPPDLVLRAAESQKETPEVMPSPDSNGSGDSGPVPETLLSRVDSLPTRHTNNSFTAHRRSPSDALPDCVETIEDTSGMSESSRCRTSEERLTNPGFPVSSTTRSVQQDSTRENDQLINDEAQDQEPEAVPGEGEGSGDEFSDFKDETAEDDDFGDFDDGFQAPADEEISAEEQTPPPSTYFVSIPARLAIPSTC